MNKVGRNRWFAVESPMAALLAGYGTLALVGLPSVTGVSMTITAKAWAGDITVLAGLTACGIALGLGRHRRQVPITLALTSFGLIARAMLGHYDRTLQIGGFALLVVHRPQDSRSFNLL